VSGVVAISASTFQLSTVFAPVFAGFLYVVGPDFVYALVGALLGIATYSSLKIKTLKDQEYGVSKGIAWKSFIEGLNFVRHNRSILGAISLDMMTVLLGGATAVLPIIASKVLKTGPWGPGLLSAAPALGAILISLWLTRYPLEKNVWRWLFGSVIVFGLATVILGLS
jgi:MFS family permease